MNGPSAPFSRTPFHFLPSKSNPSPNFFHPQPQNTLPEIPTHPLPLDLSTIITSLDSLIWVDRVDLSTITYLKKTLFILLDEELVTKADRGYLNSLLDKMSSSLSDQKEAAKKPRLVTKRSSSFRTLFGESIETISQLLNPLSPGQADAHPDLQEDLITTLLNISIHDNNKRLVAENSLVICLLIESLVSGTIQTKCNAAATFFTLSAVDSSKNVIGASGAIKPLIDLLDEGHPLAIKDAASAIFSLCTVVENKRRATNAGAVGVILKKIMDCVLVAELLAILAMLSSHQKAVQEMCELGAVSCLLGIINETDCERKKENCVAIIYTILFSDRTKLKEIKEEEMRNGTFSRLAKTGTLRAKRKANGILERLNRTGSITHTA